MERRTRRGFDSRRTRGLIPFAAWLVAAGLAVPGVASEYVPSAIRPPAPMREFRGVWVASVKNIDWPSQPGLTTARQKAELIALLDRAAQLKLNAVLLQIRPSCDALYSSKLEPWSEYLSGRMGQPPAPFYDPLAFAIEEAHQRGLELHVWLNPFRARHVSGISPLAASHISQTRPRLVKTYGKSLWLDPGEPEAHDWVVRVILDVVQRYNIDGVHFDDYFYPYQEPGPTGQSLPFPDWSSWKRYMDSGGKLSKEDWRRQNVNSFVLRIGKAIKAQKPWVKFGISPFGIWRPGHPEQIRGLDAYDTLFADARKWFVEGWVDYLAPQLYWPTSQPQQSFPVLLKWWAEQNGRQRHLWPGLSLGNEPEEIVNQIRLARKRSTTPGHILWSMKPLLQNRHGISDVLLKQVYAEPALPPALPQDGSKTPAAPQLSAEDGPGLTVRWNTGNAPKPAWWLVQSKHGAMWSSDILSGQITSLKLAAGSKPDAVAVSAIDRFGASGSPSVLERKTGQQSAQPLGAR